MHFILSIVAFATAVAAQAPLEPQWPELGWYYLDALNSEGYDDTICNFAQKTVCVKAAPDYLDHVYTCDGSNWQLTDSCGSGHHCEQPSEGALRICV